MTTDQLIHLLNEVGDGGEQVLIGFDDGDDPDVTHYMKVVSVSTSREAAYKTEVRVELDHSVRWVRLKRREGVSIP